MRQMCSASRKAITITGAGLHTLLCPLSLVPGMSHPSALLPSLLSCWCTDSPPYLHLVFAHGQDPVLRIIKTHTSKSWRILDSSTCSARAFYFTRERACYTAGVDVALAKEWRIGLCETVVQLERTPRNKIHE